jgi:hypothetical protein
MWRLLVPLASTSVINSLLPCAADTTASHAGDTATPRCLCKQKLMRVVLLQVAAQLYPGYTLLQQETSSTSSIAAAVAEARKAPSAPTRFMVILADFKKPVLVDKPLTIGPDESWVLATPAGLQAAADGVALEPEDLLPVRCSALAKGAFITNR